MLHPATRLTWISDTVGYGVVATAPLPAGTIVWAPDPLDLRLNPAQVAALPEAVRRQVLRLTYVDQHGNRVLAWDRGRHVNHSCDPALCSAGYDCSVAARDIAIGQEITEDYGSYVGERFPCACGTASCRGEVRPERDPALLECWQRRFERILPRIPAVEQPLWELLSPADRRDLLAAASGQESCRPLTLLLAAPLDSI